MNKRLLRWLTVIVPVVFLVGILAFVDFLFAEDLSFGEVLLSLIVVSVGGTLFSSWVFSFIDRREAEIHRRANQLEALNAASLALTTELDIGLVLQKVVDLSRDLVSCKFGALGVLDEEGKHFEQFVTSGVSQSERRKIGDPPVGKGIFSVLIREGKPIMLDDLQAHGAHMGFPANHPKMQSMIGVPIQAKGKIIGDLYLTDKYMASDPDAVIQFTKVDQQVLEMFATQAAIAIENARLYRQVQQLAILEERQRFGMDLHDGVIQSIYAVGLMLEDTQRRVDSDPQSARQAISRAILSLNNAISDIRNYILDLRPQHFQGRNVVQGVEELARALRANTFMNVQVDADGIDPASLSPEQTVEILHIAQEALSNVQKHARASDVDISVWLEDGRLEMVVADNGVSFTPEDLKKAGGNGLRNMSERAGMLFGDVQVRPREEGGTEVFLSIPVEEKN